MVYSLIVLVGVQLCSAHEPDLPRKGAIFDSSCSVFRVIRRVYFEVDFQIYRGKFTSVDGNPLQSSRHSEGVDPIVPEPETY